MKFLYLAIPASIVSAIYFLIYRQPIISNTTINQVAANEMLHLHILFWWNAFLYLLFCLFFSFLNISRYKLLIVSGLGISLISIIVGFISGFVFAEQLWGVYFTWDTRFLISLSILSMTLFLFAVSFVADKNHFLRIGLRVGLFIVLFTFFASHFVGYYITASHPNSTIIKILMK